MVDLEHPHTHNEIDFKFLPHQLPNPELSFTHHSTQNSSKHLPLHFRTWNEARISRPNKTLASQKLVHRCDLTLMGGNSPQPAYTEVIVLILHVLAQKNPRTNGVQMSITIPGAANNTYICRLTEAPLIVKRWNALTFSSGVFEERKFEMCYIGYHILGEAQIGVVYIGCKTDADIWSVCPLQKAVE